MTASALHRGRTILAATLLVGILGLSGCNEEFAGSDTPAESVDSVGNSGAGDSGGSTGGDSGGSDSGGDSSGGDSGGGDSGGDPVSGGSGGGGSGDDPVSGGSGGGDSGDDPVSGGSGGGDSGGDPVSGGSGGGDSGGDSGGSGSGGGDSGDDSGGDGSAGDSGDDSGGDDSGDNNSAPAITGTPPASVKVGDDYSFEPSVSDPDGDTITFDIDAQPAWASFDSATGTLSGTPQAADIGPYDGIVISASDGTATDSLGFSVAVNQVEMGTVTVSWTAPTRNSDGSALTDLAGYRIYYGTNEGDYNEMVRVDNAGTTVFVVDNLSPDTYYFVATSINADGIESDFSGAATATVN